MRNLSQDSECPVLETAFQLAPFIILTVDDAGRIITSNPAIEPVLKYTNAELPGLSFLQLVESPGQPDWQEWLATQGRGNGGAGILIKCIDKDREPVTIHWSFRREPGNPITYAFGREVSREPDPAVITLLEKRVLKLNADSSLSIQYVIDNLLTGIEDLYPGSICSILKLSQENTLLAFSAPHLPKEFTAMVNGQPPGPTAGSCGTAVFYGKVVIVSDIMTDPLWEDYKELAAGFGLRSCWSMPFRHTSGRILGTFAIYHRYVSAPSAAKMGVIERLANFIGLLIENREMIDTLRLSNERYDLSAMATHDMIWDWDLQASVIYRSEEAMRNIYGFGTNDPIRRVDDWMERIHPEDRERVRREVNGVVFGQTEKTFEVEYRFLRADDEYVYIHDRGYIMRDQEGKAIRVIGAAQDITLRVRSQQMIRDSEERYQTEIVRATIGAQEKERHEIGHELHDNVNQILTSSKLYFECVGLYDERKEEYRLMGISLIMDAIEEIRRISKLMAPPRLHDIGLISCIDDLLVNMSAVRSLQIDFLHEGFDEFILDDGLKLTIYRIVQEQTTNILKHAEATQITISLCREEDEVRFSIRDNGKGFDTSSANKGIGLMNIINRSSLHNGRVRIESAPGQGFWLEIVFGGVSAAA